MKSNPSNVFVFVVCGAKEHIDTLHFSLNYLKHFSSNNIIVVTDSIRNEIPVLHEKVMDVKTPETFNHHQASIWLKTSLHRILPEGPIYCYLDSDIIAVNSSCDKIFEQFMAPVTFAADHCTLPYFSPYAVHCSCAETYTKEIEAFNQAVSSVVQHPNYPPDYSKNGVRKIIEISSQSHKSIFLLFRILLAYVFGQFKIKDGIRLSVSKKRWINDKANITYPYLYAYRKEIFKKTGYKKTLLSRKWIKPNGTILPENKCNHLSEAVAAKFNIKITELQWQHWNGGAFLFDKESHDFLENWHIKTLEIFNDPYWKTRDQGSLVATVWALGLQNHKVLTGNYNYIADYFNWNLHADISKPELTIKNNNHTINPSLVHVYHQFGNKNWDIWQQIEHLFPQSKTLSAENKIIHGLWVDGNLTSMEIITILSAQEMGHEFHLWTYNKDINAPSGTVVRNAEEIIPAHEVFKKATNDPVIGIGKGSYGAPFSDLFRYKLLMLHGGWWVDMDITFFKPLNFETPYFFRGHPYLSAIGNVMKVPKDSDLMKKVYEETKNKCNEKTSDWLLPNKILNKHIAELQLQNFIRSDISNQDMWAETKNLILTDQKINPGWYLIHWMNEEWKRYDLNKNMYVRHSVYGSMLEKHRQSFAKTSFLKLHYHRINQSYFFVNIRKLFLILKHL